MTASQGVWLIPLIALLCAGLIAGFAAGIFGIGGGFIVVPALMLVLPLLGGDKHQYAHVAIGTSAATIILTSLRSLRSHDWPHHLAKLQAFWSSVLLTSGRYKGQPMVAHVEYSDLGVRRTFPEAIFAMRGSSALNFTAS